MTATEDAFDELAAPPTGIVSTREAKMIHQWNCAHARRLTEPRPATSHELATLPRCHKSRPAALGAGSVPPSATDDAFEALVAPLSDELNRWQGLRPVLGVECELCNTALEVRTRVVLEDGVMVCPHCEVSEDAPPDSPFGIMMALDAGEPGWL